MGLLRRLLLQFACNTPKKSPIQAAVVSARIEASAAGRDILQQGGNAYDAMIATSFALTVVFPNAGNITGGGFFVYRTADGKVGSLDYRERAPQAATHDMYLDEEGNVIPDKSTLGGLAVGVPGSVAGLLKIHEQMGSLPLSILIKPAIDLAEKGYVVTEKQARSLAAKRDQFIQVNGTESLYSKAYTAGDTIVNLALANTLKEIARKGKDGFYKGWVAQAMVDRTQATGGILTLEDLIAYSPKWRDPIEFSYKDLRIFSMGPPSSGGICLGQMLKMVEPYDLASLGHNSV